MTAGRLLPMRGLRGPPVAAMVALAAVVACLALLASPATGTSYVPIASWDFNEGSGTTAADQSGHGHTATLTSGATWGTGASGGPGDSSLNLNGTSAYAAVPDSPELNLQHVGFRIEAEVYLNAYDVNYSAVMAKRSQTQPWPGWMFLVGGTSAWGNPAVQKHLTFTLNGGGYTVTAYGSTDVPLNTWTNIAVEFDDATNQLRFFVNGVADPAAYLTSDITNGAGTALRIGSDTSSPGGSYFFNGRLDDVSIGVVPEPLTMAGLVMGIGGLATYLRRRR